VHQSIKEFIKYGLVGITGAVVDFLVFFILRDLAGIPYWIASIIGNIAGIFNNFFLNRQFTFKTKDKALKRGISFGTIGIVGLIINALLTPFTAEVLLPWTIEKTGIDLEIINVKSIQTVAKMMVTVFVAVVQFFANKYITFKRTGSKNNVG